MDMHHSCDVFLSGVPKLSQEFTSRKNFINLKWGLDDCSYGCWHPRSACISITIELLGTGLSNRPLYGKEAIRIVLNRYGSWVESDSYRSKAVQSIVDVVLPYKCRACRHE